MKRYILSGTPLYRPSGRARCGRLPAKKLRKRLLIGVLAAVFLCASCGKEEEPKKPEKTVVTLWYYWDISNIQMELATLIDRFNASQNQIEVQAQYVPDDDFKKRMAYNMADDHLPDLALVDSSDFIYLNSMQPFVDLTDLVPELSDYLPAALDSCTQDGRIYGMPFGMNCVALFYNRSMLEQSGFLPPKTWSEFRQVASGIGCPSCEGFAISALIKEETTFAFLPILWSMGGDVERLDSPESGRAFGLLRELVEEGGMTKEQINIPMGDLADQFVEGNMAMMFNTNSKVYDIRQSNPELEFDVVPIPSDGAGVTVVGGEVFGVAPGPRQEEAVAFLRYLADRERMEDYISRFGYLAPRQDVMDGQFREDPLMQKFVDMFPSARTRNFTREWPFVSEVVAEAVRQSIIGSRSVKEIQRQAAEQIRKVEEELR